MSRPRTALLPLLAAKASNDPGPGSTRLAERLAVLAEASGLALAQIDQRVLDLALAAVAEAEQRLQAQQQRIDYLESLSVTDELTRVRNRRGFHAELERALADSGRSGRGGVVLLIDLDGFKAINDTHGHAAGDFVLQTVAGWLDGQVRPGDTVARLGGDEFAVLMPMTDAESGRVRATGLDRRLNQLVARWGRRPLRIRASVGIAVFEPKESADDVLARADATMYEKKRNRAGLMPAPVH
jgi:diguanylate cyclase (GGDEF)-like protein